jgi:hypothetical protein
MRRRPENVWPWLLDLRAAGALKVDLKFARKLALIVMSSDRLSVFFQIQLPWLRLKWLVQLLRLVL